LAGLRGFVFGEEVAANGLEFNQLFALDLNFNLMLWREQKVYLFVETTFWGQKPSPGITNSNQGVFDFSKREIDYNMGVAWNYSGALEARVFGYSFNNLNRGTSKSRPSGYDDGIGLENRYYLGATYADLGTAAFDVARASFLSLGYYPTKDMIGLNGDPFNPGLMARAYVTLDLFSDRYYLYLDVELIARRPITPKLFHLDGGVALRPFDASPRLEFRLGSEYNYDLQIGDLETSLYLSLRYVF